ncbi:hypothetical protein H632_c4949p0, partial [Helicosporidium sp. ATCC 50920]
MNRMRGVTKFAVAAALLALVCASPVWADQEQDAGGAVLAKAQQQISELKQQLAAATTKLE